MNPRFATTPPFSNDRYGMAGSAGISSSGFPQAGFGVDGGITAFAAGFRSRWMTRAMASTMVTAIPPATVQAVSVVLGDGDGGRAHAPATSRRQRYGCCQRAPPPRPAPPVPPVPPVPPPERCPGEPPTRHRDHSLPPDLIVGRLGAGQEGQRSRFWSCSHRDSADASLARVQRPSRSGRTPVARPGSGGPCCLAAT